MRVFKWGMHVVGRDLLYPSPTTPWDSGIGDLHSSMEAPRVPPTEATQYMSQHLMRAWGSETGSMFHEGVWPPRGRVRLSSILY